MDIRTTGRKLLDFFAIIGIVFVVLAVILAGMFFYRQFRPRQYTTPVSELLKDAPKARNTAVPVARIRKNQVLTAEKGVGDQVFDLTVPSDCGRQLLEFTARPDEAGIYAWVMFRVEDHDGGRIEYAGPESVEGVTESSFSWNVPEGDFVFEVSGDNARWEYSLKCQ